MMVGPFTFDPLFKHIIRIGPALPRCVLLALWFPITYLDFVLGCALWHPDKRRWLDADFWLLPVDMTWVAALGEFVPSD
jgi:hypothetical protein